MGFITGTPNNTLHYCHMYPPIFAAAYTAQAAEIFGTSGMQARHV